MQLGTIVQFSQFKSKFIRQSIRQCQLPWKTRRASKAEIWVRKMPAGRSIEEVSIKTNCEVATDLNLVSDGSHNSEKLLPTGSRSGLC